MKFKTIGILGGMGPLASATLYKSIIDYMQCEYDAIQDNDYPHIIINSLPLENFSEKGIEKIDTVTKQLITGVQTLENAGCDTIIIACNTVHLLYPQMQNSIQIPIINMIDCVSKAVKAQNIKKTGLLTSQTTKNTKLYQKYLKKYGIESITTNSKQQAKINKIIENIMGGTHGEKDNKQLRRISEEMLEKGAQSIILGCTELPLALKGKSSDKIPIFDSIEIITKEAVNKSRA